MNSTSIFPQFLSKLLERMKKLFVSLTDFNYLQSYSLPTGNIGQLKQLQSRLCPTFTKRQTLAPLPFSAFSTSAPRSTRSTIAFYLIALRTTTVSADGSFSGSSHTSRDTVNSRGTTGSPQRRYQSPLVCRKSPSWGRSFLSPTRPKSSLYRSASGLQSARVRRRPTNLRIDGSERCC